MPKYLIEVDDIKSAHWHTRADLKKMFANAVEAVEYKVEDVVLTAANGDTATMANPKIDGQPVTLYAVAKEANNGKV